MIELNLTANTEPEKRILKYLQNNASKTLADKVNNGTPFEKDGKPLLNKKTLADFMKYACEEARKLAEKGANSACIEDSVVYGWAVHFFEEESIVGTLYNADGTEYKPVVKAAAKPITKPVVTETKPKQVQWSLFDMVNETAQENEVKDTANDTLTEELDTDDEEFTEEEKLDAMRQVAEEEQSQAIESIVEEPKGNRLYQDYKLYQSERPTAVVALRLGDFYEVLGDNAVMLGNEMDLTITSRDVGLKERVPMIGFPYHAAENYFAKIVKKHDLYIVENERDTQFIPCLLCVDNRLIDQDTGEIIEVTPTDDCTEKRQYVQPKHDKIIDYLTELFSNEMEIKL
ncbi:MAG TPA: hypothetical protein DHU79_02865 [Clostridiales bacterium]|nr:hypothetical protein [Clostridiales bacterium]